MSEKLEMSGGTAVNIGGSKPLPCGHEGPTETSRSARGRVLIKCITCGRVFAENPYERREDEGPDAPNKRNCLKEADKIINGERQDSYGAPEDSFTVIAGYWNVFLNAKLKPHGVAIRNLISPLDVTNMMVLFKQARKLGQKPSRDNYVDSCGYEAIGADRLSE